MESLEEREKKLSEAIWAKLASSLDIETFTNKTSSVHKTSVKLKVMNRVQGVDLSKQNINEGKVYLATEIFHRLSGWIKERGTARQTIRNLLYLTWVYQESSFRRDNFHSCLLTYFDSQDFKRIYDFSPSQRFFFCSFRILSYLRRLTSIGVKKYNSRWHS